MCDRFNGIAKIAMIAKIATITGMSQVGLGRDALNICSAGDGLRFPVKAQHPPFAVAKNDDPTNYQRFTYVVVRDGIIC